MQFAPRTKNADRTAHLVVLAEAPHQYCVGLHKITRTARMPRVSPAHGVSARRLAAPETQTWYHD